MASFAFWNVNRKDLGSVVCRFVQEREIDFIALCESRTNPDEMVAGLNDLSLGQYHYLPGILEDRFQVFFRFRLDFVSLWRERARRMILAFELPGLPSFHLMLLHANSPANFISDKNIAAEVRDMGRSLRAMEEESGHSRWLVVGDFNQNPYSDGLVYATGFHAIMDMAEARRHAKGGKLSEHTYFYNPMWSLFGDQSKGPPGTHYFRGKGLIEQQWHILDQVLVRPSLCDYFSARSVEIVDNIAGLSLLNSRSRPDTKAFSDHLPLYFELTP